VRHSNHYCKSAGWGKEWLRRDEHICIPSCGKRPRGVEENSKSSRPNFPLQLPEASDDAEEPAWVEGAMTTAMFEEWTYYTFELRNPNLGWVIVSPLGWWVPLGTGTACL
jgi:hypothetical protein